MLKCSHTFYPLNGLSELLEKLEFSKGTEWLRTEGMRISFINHYDVRIEEDNILSDIFKHQQDKKGIINSGTNGSSGLGGATLTNFG